MYIVPTEIPSGCANCLFAQVCGTKLRCNLIAQMSGYESENMDVGYGWGNLERWQNERREGCPLREIEGRTQKER